ncbi:hypothetical protein HPB51_027749 [Rhipicephalus microplus]|uniref:G-protein coupled receptors family 1 profile domain-containing protein n=1 Tax=Rhipicephalus microplus TaxID=6941 RepID=A0A9J6CZB9_RHIMP|nr:hypothetical protein HPB51_027749 [Rhipicephalus microplus]
MSYLTLIPDLGVGLVSVLTDIIWKTTVDWHGGNFGCKVVKFAQVLVTYSSTYVLVALSIDRSDAITRPMNFSGSCAHGKDINTRRTSSRGVIPKAKVKTDKMTLIIVLAFVFCWSPYFMYDLFQVYGATPKTQAAIAVATFIQSLAPLNSVANPLIYYFFLSNMCRHIRHEALLTMSPQEPPSL